MTVLWCLCVIGVFSKLCRFFLKLMCGSYVLLSGLCSLVVLLCVKVFS